MLKRLILCYKLNKFYRIYGDSYAMGAWLNKLYKEVIA